MKFNSILHQTYMVSIAYGQGQQVTLTQQAINLISNVHYVDDGFCPNLESNPDLIISGNRHLDGRVQARIRAHLEVSRGFELILRYEVLLEALDSETEIRATKAVVIERARGGNLICGFRKRGTTRWYTEWSAVAEGILPPGGFEAKPFFYHDGHLTTLTFPFAEGDGPFRSVSLVGDTGTEDISDDEDCHHDSHISSLDLFDLEVAQCNSELTAERPRNMSISLVGTAIGAEVHNGDCLRHYGQIRTLLFKGGVGFCQRFGGESHPLIDWRSGNATRDFQKRNLTQVLARNVNYEVDLTDLENNDLSLLVDANSLKACHKGCDLCSDYRCNIEYQNQIVNLQADQFTESNGSKRFIVPVRLQARNAGLRPDPNNHRLSFSLVLRYEEDE